jgi:hypothetical protein
METRFIVFDTRDEAVAAVRELERDGVDASLITVMSSEPLHIETGASPKTRISGFAIAGGVLGAALAILLTVVTSRRVGIITGGMPIVSPWAFGIIVFEMTMLGAILVALGRMVFESSLMTKLTAEPYDDAVSDGKIVVVVDQSE